MRSLCLSRIPAFSDGLLSLLCSLTFAQPNCGFRHSRAINHYFYFSVFLPPDSVYLSVFLSVFLSARVFVCCVYVCLFLCLSLYLAVCVYFFSLSLLLLAQPFLSICVCLCLSLSLSLS